MQVISPQPHCNAHFNDAFLLVTVCYNGSWICQPLPQSWPGPCRLELRTTAPYKLLATMVNASLCDFVRHHIFNIFVCIPTILSAIYQQQQQHLSSFCQVKAIFIVFQQATLNNTQTSFFYSIRLKLSTLKIFCIYVDI